MQHGEQQVADAGLAIDWAGTNLIVGGGISDVVFVDLGQIEKTSMLGRPLGKWARNVTVMGFAIFAII